MARKSFFKDSSKFFIAVPVLLLLLSLVFSTKIPESDSNAAGVNPYLKSLPNSYQNLIDVTNLNDSTFFVKVLETPLSRELIIFKVFPTTDDIKKRFNIEVKLDDSKKKIAPTNLKFEIRSEGSKFKHENYAIAIFKQAIPVTKIKSISVSEYGALKQSEAWKTEINTPLDSKYSGRFELSKTETSSNDKAPNVYKPIFEKILNVYQIEFDPAVYALKKDSLIQRLEPIESVVAKNNITIAKVSKPNSLWNKLNKKDENLIEEFILYGEQKDIITKLLDDQTELAKIFDINKLADYNAIKDVFSMYCNEPMYFVYQEETGLLEPFFITSKCLGSLSKYVRRSSLKDQNYSKAYALALHEISSLDILKLVEDDVNKLNEEIGLISSYYPSQVFDFDALILNQRVVYKNLTPSLAIKVELLSMDSNSMQLVVKNISGHPIQIKSLDYQKTKNITTLNPPKELLYQVTDTISIDLPRSFENLFTSKKKKTAGFNLFKDIYDLKIGYAISGIDNLQYAPIIPYQSKETLGEDIFRNPPSLLENENFKIDEVNKIITLASKAITINETVIIPKGYIFKLSADQSIDMIQNGSIISYASLEFLGSSDKPIKIYSSDQKGQGLIVISSEQKSVLNHVVFDQLRNPKTATWSVTGAITFYESPVDLNYVTISNNKCEDALNIIRTEFVMNNSTISNAQSDAFDGDFVKGKIINSKFINLGNDGIDVSGSNLEIKNVSVINAGDKGLSAGEDSVMNIEKVTIEDSEIGVASKDLSSITINDIKITTTRLGFTAFQKKSEFGPSNIKVTELKLTDVELDYLIEDLSTLMVNGKQIETSQNVKDRLYGAEFGVNTSETRGN